MLYIAGQIFDMQVLAGFAVLYLSNLRQIWWRLFSFPFLS